MKNSQIKPNAPKRHIDWSMILFIAVMIVVVLLVIVSFGFSGTSEPFVGWGGVIISLMLFIIFGGGFWWSIFKPNKRSRTMKFQAKLPIQHIGSLSPGLAKVQGKAKSITPVEAAIESKTCVGYRYHIQAINESEDGEYYTNIEDRIECPRFIFADETGSMEVDTGSGRLEFIGLPVDDAYLRKEGKLFQQYLLKEGEEMMLIGNVSIEGGRRVMRYDEKHDMFAIAPITDVSIWVKNRPVVRSLAVQACFTLLLLVLVFFYLSVEVEGGVATIGLGEILGGLLSKWLPAGASYSFACGSWFESVVSDNGNVLMFFIFGPFIAVPVLLLLGWAMKKIGLEVIAKWSIWFRLGVSLAISMILNAIILPLMSSILPTYDYEMENGLRILLGGLVIFVSVFGATVVHLLTPAGDDG